MTTTIAPVSADETDTALPLTNTAKELYIQAIHDGLTALYFAGVYRLMNE